MLSRRRLLQFFAIVPALGIAPAAVPRVPVLTMAIAGGRHHALAARLGALALGRTLLLAREADNPFDPNAVAIHDLDGARLGYVPRRAAARIAALLEDGETLEARIVGRWDDGGPRPETRVVFTDVWSGDPLLELSRAAVTGRRREESCPLPSRLSYPCLTAGPDGRE